MVLERRVVDEGHEDAHQLAAAADHQDHQAAGVAQADQGGLGMLHKRLSTLLACTVRCKGTVRSTPLTSSLHALLAGSEVRGISQPQGLHVLQCGARSRDHWRRLVCMSLPTLRAGLTTRL